MSAFGGIAEIDDLAVHLYLRCRLKITARAAIDKIYAWALVAVIYLDGNIFAEKLERAIARSEHAKLIEAKAV